MWASETTAQRLANHHRKPTLIAWVPDEDMSPQRVILFVDELRSLDVVVDGFLPQDACTCGCDTDWKALK
jgi:hypothetical protein